MTERSLKLFLAGDVMIGRGVDQLLENSVPPQMFGKKVKLATYYIDKAEEKNGPMPSEQEVMAMGGPSRYIWGDLLPALEYEKPHARLINLETALTLSEDRHPKHYPHRGHPSNALLTLRQTAQVDAASVANNHVGDYGMNGMVDTLHSLKAAGIVPVGLGMDAKEAYEAKMVAPDVSMVAMMGVSSEAPIEWKARENSPGIARSEDSYGYKDLYRTLSSLGAVAHGRPSKPLSIASLHIGLNWSHSVDAKHRWFAENLAEPGNDGPNAHLVVCHSSHHVKGFEVTPNRRLICWGLGDIINDYEGTSSGVGFLKGYCLAWLPTFKMVDGDWKFSHMRMRVYKIKHLSIKSGSDEDADALFKVLQDHSRVHDPASHSLSWSMKKDKFGPFIDAKLVVRSQNKVCKGCW